MIEGLPRIDCNIEFYDYDSNKIIAKLDDLLPISSFDCVPYRNNFVSLRAKP